MTTATKQEVLRLTKSLPVELKAEQEGAFVALFSTYDVVDHDGDVVRKGAFTAGQEVPIGAWGHDTKKLPIGLGSLVDGEDGARVDGQLFIDTTHGRDAYHTLKGLGSRAEWSYIFEVTKWSVGEMDGQSVRFLEAIDVWSVDPVLRGAGIGTRTETIKSQQLPYAEQGEQALASLLSFAERSVELASMRAKDGRSLSEANLERLKALHAGLEGVTAEIAKAIVTGEDGSTEEKQVDSQSISNSALLRLKLAEYGAASLT